MYRPYFLYQFYFVLANTPNLGATWVYFIWNYQQTLDSNLDSNLEYLIGNRIDKKFGIINYSIQIYIDK